MSPKSSSPPKPTPAEAAALPQLHEAIWEGDRERVEALLDAHPRLAQLQYADGRYPLGDAVKRGEGKIAERLLELGAQVSPPVEFADADILTSALRAGEATLAAWLVEHGATLETVVALRRGEHDLWNFVHDKCVPVVLELHAGLAEPAASLRVGLERAAGRGETKRVEAILEAAKRVAPALLDDLSRPLLLAFASKHTKEVALLEKLGARLGEVASRDAAALWSNTLRADDATSAERILELGFDIEAWEREHGSLLVHCVLHSFSTPFGKATGTLRILVEHGLDLDARAEGMTPLHAALERNHVALYRSLLEAGADPGHPHTRQQHLLLTDGALRLKDGELRQLVEAGQDLGAVDEKRGGIFHRAVDLYADREVVERVHALGADVDLQDARGRTALHVAIESEQKAIAQLLLKLGADPTRKSKGGKSALDVARKKAGMKALVQRMEKAAGKAGEAGTAAKPAAVDEVLLLRSEPWARELGARVGKLRKREGESWNALLTLAIGTTATRPSEKFMQETLELVEAAGTEGVRAILLECLPLYGTPKQARSWEDDGDPAVWETPKTNLHALRGLLWTCGHFPDSDMAAMLAEVAGAAFKKIRYVGMRNPKVGNAALNGLAAMGEVGLPQLAILREKLGGYKAASVHVERVFGQVSKAHGVTSDELAEIGASDYGLGEGGRLEEELGAHTAELTLLGPGRTELVWSKGGKTQKTVPAAVKRSHASKLTKLKALEKELRQASTAARSRLEKLYLAESDWDLPTWRERYLDHPLVGVLARRLLWTFELPGKQSCTALYRHGEFVGSTGATVAIGKATRVRLWHPLDADVDEVLAWRERLAALEVTQPFKQAHREVYVLTPAERKSGTHSRRFAEQVMAEGQAHALANARGWTATRGGHWDGGQEACFHRKLVSQGLGASWELSALEDLGTSDAGLYLYVRGGSVRFRTLATDGKRSKVVPLTKVPPIVFTEVMRDVDLCVGVANVGNDLEWLHRETLDDWTAVAFGALRPTGEIRRDAIAALIPKLKIADRQSLDDRFLVVRGDLETYRIHLGSANVMRSSGAYLCIVRTRDKAKALVLPFEGDAKLSEILSKAFLLAADTKIKDAEIVDQLKRR